MDATEAREIEKAASQAPKAHEVARKAQDDAKAVALEQRDRQARMFCIGEATKACAVGGYEPKQIIEVARGYHKFLTE